MAYEEVGNKKVGLCNAIMLAEQNSDLLAIWLNSYKSFRSKGRDAYWGEHSVVIPCQLSQLHPTLITVLPTDSFFQPAYDSVGLAMLFIEDRVFPNAYAHHLWESLSYGAIRPINEFNFEHIRNTYTSILSEVLSDELKVLRDHCQLKIDQAFTRKEASLNLGCGSKRELDKINCDLYPQTAAELNFDLEQPNWPIPDSSVKYVKVNHVLEHLQNKEVSFKELYRICAYNASISIAVPYPRHDWSLIDPTHVSYWHPDSFRHFDKQICTEWLFSDSTNTPLAIYWDINFKVISVNAQTEGAKTSSELKKIFNTDKIDLNLLNRYFNNVASEVKGELIALK